MSSAPAGPAGTPVQDAPPDPPRARGLRLSEDWIATITGLVLLLLVLAGVITKDMVP